MLDIACRGVFPSEGSALGGLAMFPIRRSARGTIPTSCTRVVG
jgi:hypothetical protein